MRVRNCPAQLLALVALLSIAAPAKADPPSAPAPPAADEKAPEGSASVTEAQREEVPARFARGVELYSEGEFKLALIEFERANATAPTYRMLYNIGQVHQQLGHFSKALRALERYAADGGARIPAARRMEVERDIVTLRARTAMLIVKVNEADAEISFDDGSIARSPMSAAERVDAGEHQLRVTKPGFVADTRVLVLAGGDEAVVEATLRPEPPPVERVVAGPVTRPQEAPPSSGRTATYVAWSATAALAIGTATLGALALSSASELKTLRGTVGSTAEAREDSRSRAQSFGVASTVVGIATAVSGVTALYLTLKKPSAPKSGDAGVRIGIAGAGVEVRGAF